MDHHQFPFEPQRQKLENFDQFLRDADAKVRSFFNFIRSPEFCAGLFGLIFFCCRYPMAFWLGRQVAGLISTPLFIIGLFYAILAITFRKSEERNPAEIVGARFFQEMVTPFPAGREPEAEHNQQLSQPLSEEIEEAEVEHNEQHAHPLFEHQEEVYFEDKKIVFEECPHFPTWDTADEEETDSGWGQQEKADNEEEVVDQVQPSETEMQNDMDFVDYILQNTQRADELTDEDFNKTLFAYIARCWKRIRQPSPDDGDDDQEEIHYYEEFYVYRRA